MLLTTGFVQQQFCPFLLRRASVWVWAGSCTLGENVTPSTHRHGTAADHLTLCVSLLHHLRRKIWSCLSTFTALSKALTDQIILCLYRFCISARRSCCTNIVLLWCGANTGKYHFTQNKWSKESSCIWTCMPCVLLLYCGAECLQEKSEIWNVI